MLDLKAQGDVIIYYGCLRHRQRKKFGFITMITNQNYLVSGYGRKKRYDSVVAKTFRLNYLIGRLRNIWSTIK
jgi:hypothetical protein